MHLRRQDKVKLLFDGIKSKIPFKINNDFKKFIMIIGSSGVGKTSVIMRLAMRYKKNYKVAIVSLGNFEAYSNLSLNMFCEDKSIRHIQLDDMTDFANMQKKLLAENFDIVLIGTVGRAPFEASLIFDIKMYQNFEEVSSILVVPANLKYKDYVDIYDCYSPLNIKSLIVSKLDETKYFHSIIKFLVKESTPFLSFVSIGKGEQFDDCLVEY